MLLLINGSEKMYCFAGDKGFLAKSNIWYFADQVQHNWNMCSAGFFSLRCLALSLGQPAIKNWVLGSAEIQTHLDPPFPW